VGAFIDTPVKRYSSGMFVRLAFAVAAHLEPEILLIDEVLAVGDAAFQKKCLGKMGEVASQHGRTVFFVSHNMGAVRSLCERALLIDGGRLTLAGKPAEVISQYLASGAALGSGNEGELVWSEEDAPRAAEVVFRSLRLLNERGIPQSSFEAGKPFTIELGYEMLQRLRGARFTITVLTQEGEIAFCATDHLFQREILTPGRYRSQCHIPGGLLNRRNYLLAVQCDIPGERYVIPPAEQMSFTISGAGNQASMFPEPWPGVVCPRIEWTVERTEESSAASQNGAALEVSSRGA
jgi:lipopolysaccharide transport system ATP-binding protein